MILVACPLLALSGHGLLQCTCPLMTQKRTSLDARDYIELDEHAQFIVATACARG
jgi:hypothetical protein